MMQGQITLPGVERIGNDDDTRSNKRKQGIAITEDRPKRKSEDISRPQAKWQEEIEINEELLPDFDEKTLNDVIEEENSARNDLAADGLSFGFIDRVIIEYNKRSNKKLDHNDPESFKLIISILTEKEIKYNKKRLREHIEYLESRN